MAAIIADPAIAAIPVIVIMIISMINVCEASFCGYTFVDHDHDFVMMTGMMVMKFMIRMMMIILIMIRIMTMIRL